MGLDKNFNTAGANEMGLDGGGLTSATLSNCLKEGKPLADTGDLYSTIQDAVNAASGWVFVPPGTFNENVVIDTNDITILGSGYNSLIKGGTGSGIVINASNVTLREISVQNGNSGPAIGTNTGADRGTIHDVSITGSGNFGIEINHGNNWNLTNILIESTGFNGLNTASNTGMVLKNWIVTSGVGNKGMVPNFDESVIANCIVFGGGQAGVQVGGNDSIVIGCRVHNTDEQGITTSGDTIVSNNRVSDSVPDIDVGGNVLLDGNLSGSAN